MPKGWRGETAVVAKRKHMHSPSPLESKQKICGASQEEGSPAGQTGATNLRLFSHTAGEDRKPAPTVHDATTSARARTHTRCARREATAPKRPGELFRTATTHGGACTAPRGARGVGGGPPTGGRGTFIACPLPRTRRLT